jgi:protein tyrosine/serine phosphatase
MYDPKYDDLSQEAKDIIDDFARRLWGKKIVAATAQYGEKPSLEPEQERLADLSGESIMSMATLRKNKTGLPVFREIHMGKIPGGLLYRGANPVLENDHERNTVYERLLYDTHISCVVNLADNEYGLKRLADLVPAYDELLRKNNVIGLDIQFGFDFENKPENEIFKGKLKQGFKFLITHDGPYLIHCNAGIDRTGFVAAILEALLGTGLDEIVQDYLLSYGQVYANNNRFKETTGQIILDQLSAITNGEINDEENFQANIEKYFLEEIDLTTRELDMLIDRLSV